MNKELERLKDYITSRPVTRYERSALEEHRYVEIDTIAITQIVNYIDNSIPKEVIENYLKDEKQKFDVYKKESEQNENLKGQIWYHMGAKNMLERILGIEKLVTLD